VGFALSPHAIILILCLGVGVALVGIAIVMPALLRTCLAVKAGSDAAQDWRGRVQLRYQNLRTYHWMFVRFKLRRDPMFLELPDLVQAAANVRTILDVGCGYGVAGCAMLNGFPKLPSTPWILIRRAWAWPPAPSESAARWSRQGRRTLSCPASRHTSILF